jgi:hypothetical protein
MGLVLHSDRAILIFQMRDDCDWFNEMFGMLEDRFNQGVVIPLIVFMIPR